MGVEPDETLMIGDSLRNDIMPADAIGIHTWRVAGDDPLGAIRQHLGESGWRQGYISRPLDSAMILPQFHGNIAALYGLLAEVKPHHWRQQPVPQEWSIMQILCHLWHSEMAVHYQRLETILTHDDPFIAAPAPPGPDIPPCHDDGLQVMRCFRQAREQTMGFAFRLEARSMEAHSPAQHIRLDQSVGNGAFHSAARSSAYYAALPHPGQMRGLKTSKP